MHYVCILVTAWRGGEAGDKVIGESSKVLSGPQTRAVTLSEPRPSSPGIGFPPARGDLSAASCTRGTGGQPRERLPAATRAASGATARESLGLLPGHAQSPWLPLQPPPGRATRARPRLGGRVHRQDCGGTAAGQGYSHKSPEAACWRRPYCPRNLRPPARGACAHWSSGVCDPDAHTLSGRPVGWRRRRRKASSDAREAAGTERQGLRQSLR